MGDQGEQNYPDARALPLRLFKAAIASAQARACLPSHFTNPPTGRLNASRAGKASAAMARAVEDKAEPTVRRRLPEPTWEPTSRFSSKLNQCFHHAASQKEIFYGWS